MKDPKAFTLEQKLIDANYMYQKDGGIEMNMGKKSAYSFVYLQRALGKTDDAIEEMLAMDIEPENSYNMHTWVPLSDIVRIEQRLYHDTNGIPKLATHFVLKEVPVKKANTTEFPKFMSELEKKYFGPLMQNHKPPSRKVFISR